uniref:alpha-N-arabinofuranosidase n=1 Tax=Altererythrobacter segetis TaxID=1104773 RepID=UPI00140B4CD3|nr:alpha-L-arabinofuranosidase C-terminal domain-containing protein [Altererythrobacter segetis]
MRMILAGAALAAIAAMPGSALARDDAATEITIESGKLGARIDRHIFGQFAEHLGTGIYGGVWVGPDSPIPNVRGIRSDVVAALKAIKVPDVRWPGGCFADEYHWRNGVGPKRRSTVNANWGGAIEPNTFGTDEFMDFAHQIGSEAYVSVNVGSGTLEEASDWMAYMTADQRSSAGADRAANGHADPYKVEFLGLGNESWGCGGNMRPQYYTDLMKRFARFTRNYNPSQQKEAMQRVAVGPTDDDASYTEAVMKAWSERDWSWSIEGHSFHSYTVPHWPPSLASSGFGEGDYATILATTLKMDGRIARHSAIMDKYDPEKKVALVVDEWGVWYAENPGTPSGFLQQQNSMRDAIVAALNFNIFARHADRVRMANIAQMVNVLQAMILTDGPKMVLTPTYYVHQLYLPFQDATFVPVEFNAGSYRHGEIALPRVDAVAARAADGKLYLALVNLDPARPTTVRVTLPEGGIKTAAGQVLTAANVNSVNTFDAPKTVIPVPIAGKVAGGAVTISLPARSVAMVGLGR